MSKEKEVARAYKDILQDYLHTDDIFSENDPRFDAVTDILRKLDEKDRIIIVLYFDCKSYRKLGERFNMSHMTVRNEVNRIKEIIFKELENYDLH